jgi:hypothetical protein
VILAPAAAAAGAALGLRFPFPRIFDRTVMVTLLAALLIWSRALGFGALMRAGFAAPRANLGPAARSPPAPWPRARSCSSCPRS